MEIVNDHSQAPAVVEIVEGQDILIVIAGKLVGIVRQSKAYTISKIDEDGFFVRDYRFYEFVGQGVNLGLGFDGSLKSGFAASASVHVIDDSVNAIVADKQLLA